MAKSLQMLGYKWGGKRLSLSISLFLYARNSEGQGLSKEFLTALCQCFNL